MAGAAQPNDELIAGINVTPLVDITLVLLVVMMITAKAVVSQALPMDLPAPAPPGEAQAVLSIALGAGGETLVDGRRVAGDEAVLASAREARAKNAEARAVIKADAQVPHGRVVRTMDLLKQAGVSKVAFGVGAALAPPAAPTPLPQRNHDRRTMAGSSPSNDDEIIAGINVTPLVDITLVLLVVMMITAKAIVSQALPMDLPKAASGSEQQDVFSVSLGAAGETAVNQQRVPSEDAILAMAREAHAKNAEVRAVIKADAQVPHGRVVRVMDLLKQAGISKVAFGVSPVPNEAGAPAPAPATSK